MSGKRRGRAFGAAPADYEVYLRGHGRNLATETKTRLAGVFRAWDAVAEYQGSGLHVDPVAAREHLVTLAREREKALETYLERWGASPKAVAGVLRFVRVALDVREERSPFDASIRLVCAAAQRIERQAQHAARTRKARHHG